MRCCPVCYAKAKPIVSDTVMTTEHRPLGQAWKSSIRFSVGIADLDAIKQAVS